MNFKKLLGKELLIFDGAMGTLLQARGLQAGEIPETWNILHPEIIADIHTQYLNAGSAIMKANTFGANRYKCVNTSYTVNTLVKAGIDIAKNAARDVGKEAFVALDVGSLGKLLKPLGTLDFDEAFEAFKEIMLAGKNAGADLILIETMSDTYETKAALLAAKEATDLPVVVSMVFDEGGKLLTGGDIPAVCAMLEALGADAIGFNCGLGPSQMLKLLPQLTACCSLPISINPNAGMPVVENGETLYKITPEAFAESAKQLVQGGAHLIGGCCGTTPAHIAAVAAACKDIKLAPVTDKNLTVVSSYTHAVCFGDKPVIIGERINPTGKSRFKQALRENDFDYIYKEAINQEENGAEVLDVNVGLPEIDEVSVMQNAVTGIQSISALPLQIDTTNITALETALRLYNGKAMINSVNGKEESMRAVFPLVKKYGGVVVCLTLDESGIPETAAQRIAIAEKIAKTAESYGIKRKDLIVDTLTMTVSTGADNAKITLDALKHIKNEMKLNTVLGVSNISFGLPVREKITAAFFTLAMQSGLSAGIVNPLSEPIMSAYYSYCALMGHDAQCAKYIEKYSGTIAAPVKQGGEMTLFDAVVKGMAESAAKATTALIETTDGLEIINMQLIPALDKVGVGFENKTMFLPQLLMSADAAKASFDVIRANIEKSGNKAQQKCKIVLATVKGDVHDIGKNIVKVLLQNYGFEVIDLGKDVPPQAIVDTVLRENVKLVGLSALMTTTVVNMDETIKLLRKQAPSCLVMVGGAVLTQQYADMLGADFYSKDAIGSVRWANKMYDENKI